MTGGEGCAPENGPGGGGGGGGLPDNEERAGSENAGSGSPRGGGNDEVLCNVLGEGCLSCGGISEKGLGGAFDVKGDGKLGGPGIEVGTAGGYGACFEPEITSDSEGRDCLWDSVSSDVLRESVGEIIPGMLELDPG